MSAGEVLTIIMGAVWYGGGQWLLVRVRRADDGARHAREIGGEL